MIQAQFEALAVDTRRQIYTMVMEQPRSVRELADELPVSRPAVSQHLKVLSDAGLVRVATVGTRRVYSADPAGAAAFRRWADSLWSEAIGRFADFAIEESKEDTMLAEEVRVEPVVKSLRLALSPEAAFELFTTRIAEWWPLDTHSVGEAQSVTVRIESTVGGKILETTADGVDHEWGTVTAYEKGSRIEFTWYPGLPEDQQTLVDVKFRETAGGSEMILVHTGWESRGDDARTVRGNYDKGWDHVLGRYIESI